MNSPHNDYEPEVEILDNEYEIPDKSINDRFKTQKRSDGKIAILDNNGKEAATIAIDNEQIVNELQNSKNISKLAIGSSVAVVIFSISMSVWLVTKEEKTESENNPIPNTEASNTSFNVPEAKGDYQIDSSRDEEFLDIEICFRLTDQSNEDLCDRMSADACCISTKNLPEGSRSCANHQNQGCEIGFYIDNNVWASFDNFSNENCEPQLSHRYFFKQDEIGKMLYAVSRNIHTNQQGDLPEHVKIKPIYCPDNESSE